MEATPDGQKRVRGNNQQRRRGSALLLTCLLLGSGSAAPLWAAGENGAAPRTWRALNELSGAELAEVDLTTDTPRHAETPYLPAEPFPFTPPYTAEEMGYRAMEFTQRPRWSCAYANIFGSISGQGIFLGQGRAVNLVAYPAPAGAAGELARKPGEEVYRQLTQTLFPPEAYGAQSLLIRYRTDQRFVKKEDSFAYTPALRRVRRQTSLRRNDHYPQMAMTFDDSSGRSAWEFSWTLLGADVLFTTVRFPVTRPRVTVTETDGAFREVATKDFKLMGDDYPLYTADGGVRCYVVEARAREEWLPEYSAPRLLYWLDTHAFYPLRIETYDRENKLVRVEVRLSKRVPIALDEHGYGPFLQVYWDLETDILTYNIRDGIRLMPWSPDEVRTYFSPDFMRRQWYPALVRSYLGVERPEAFFLRPGLESGKFPENRPIRLSPELRQRVQAQDAAGRLVFEAMTPAMPSVQ